MEFVECRQAAVLSVTLSALLRVGLTGHKRVSLRPHAKPTLRAVPCVQAGLAKALRREKAEVR
jgi:hypothetical protein